MLADPLRFKQVVLNLLSNAVKFTPDGGRVTLAAALGADELHVTVTDTGVGVPPEDRERIFESFQQGGRGTTREEGTGLGLTLTKRIVELFGGRLWLDTTVGVGSTFGFSLPRRRSGTSEAPAREATPGRCCCSSTTTGRRSTWSTAYLDGSGVDIVRARDGAEALEQARRLRAGGGRPRHPAAQGGRVGGAGGAQVRPEHRGHPGRGRLDRRRAVPRPVPRVPPATSPSRSGARACWPPCGRPASRSRDRDRSAAGPDGVAP